MTIVISNLSVAVHTHTLTLNYTTMAN